MKAHVRTYLAVDDNYQLAIRYYNLLCLLDDPGSSISSIVSNTGSQTQISKNCIFNEVILGENVSKYLSKKIIENFSELDSTSKDLIINHLEACEGQILCSNPNDEKRIKYSDLLQDLKKCSEGLGGRYHVLHAIP